MGELSAAPPPQRHVALTVQVLNVFRVLWLFIVADTESEYVRRVHCSLSLVTFRSVSQAVASIITGNLGVTAACRITSSLIDTHWTHYPVLPARSFISLRVTALFIPSTASWPLTRLTSSLSNTMIDTAKSSIATIYLTEHQLVYS